jgi:hypothetical protein
MTSVVWLNVAAMVGVVGIWAFAVAFAYRVLAREERGPATVPPTAQRAADRVRGAASERTGSRIHLIPASSARGRRQAGRQYSPAGR